MNGTPITPDSGLVPYTVIGAPKSDALLPERKARGSLPVILLNRGSRLYRTNAISELERAGLGPILSIELRSEVLDAESLAADHPAARFLLLSQPASPGVQINLAMRECQEAYVLVLWNDMSLASQGLSSRFIDRVEERDVLCLAPLLCVGTAELLPSAMAPALDSGSGRFSLERKRSLKVLGCVPEVDGEKSLFPFDYTGIYNRARFAQLGGYDAGLGSPYWQKLDFGFRAWLWGEEIRISQALKVLYSGEPVSEDETADESYKWFWLKNLAPSFRGDHSLISGSRFWSYLRSRRSAGMLSAWGEFRGASEWVRLNRYRFRTDASSLVELWDESSS